MKNVYLSALLWIISACTFFLVAKEPLPFFLNGLFFGISGIYLLVSVLFVFFDQARPKSNNTTFTISRMTGGSLMTSDVTYAVNGKTIYKGKFADAPEEVASDINSYFGKS